MGGEAAIQSWFVSLWKTKTSSEPEIAIIGILAFEVVSLMSKLVSLWHCLSDNQINRLREELIKSIGIKKLVSDSDDFLIELVIAEIIENLGYVARSVSIHGKGTVASVYHHLETVFSDPIENSGNWYGWNYRLKKMERKVKKMERFIAVTGQLHQELEVLSELEQTFRRMQVNPAVNKLKLLEFQQKVVWQRQEVKHLCEMSPWNRTYDYIVRLLSRSIFTILARIKHLFGTKQMKPIEEKSDNFGYGLHNDCLPHANSISVLMHSTVYPSANNPSVFLSGHLKRSISKSGYISDKVNRTKNKQQQAPYLSSASLHQKQLWSKSKHFTHVGPFKGCLIAETDSPILQSCSGFHSKHLSEREVVTNGFVFSSNHFDPKLSLFNSKHRLLNAPPSTLGAAALALHYANIIILIEKIACSPHLVGLDMRDDLYNMLTTNLKGALRERLKSCTETGLDASLAIEWNVTLGSMLEWLSPLAHNMIRWQSERNFERQHAVSRTNVLLVQTLFFANQGKAEAAITELLVGLSYVCRYGREYNRKALWKSAGTKS